MTTPQRVAAHPLATAIVVIGLTGLTAGAFYGKRSGPDTQIFSTPLTRGEIVQSIGASGTLEAMTTVQVGSQLSGSVAELHADFNSIVHAGQVLARLDPSLYKAQVDQARANLAGAKADSARQAASVTDAATKLARAEELSRRELLPAADLETAQTTLKTAQAQKASADAQVTQAQAALDQAQLNLEKTVITAPIDGIVIARNVDVGQTVAASLSAPTLFVIAADLSKMRVHAMIDEAEVGRIAVGQPVTFHVDAYPEKTFEGVVSQVRLDPTVEQNVVTYTALIDVRNDALELKPGMTATVSIEVGRADGVLRAPVSALRFNPSAEALAALGEAAPEPSSHQTVPNEGRLWIDRNGTLQRIVVETGLSDGSLIAVSANDLSEGTPIVTRVATSSTTTAPTSGSVASNPFLGASPARRGGR